LYTVSSSNESSASNEVTIISTSNNTVVDNVPVANTPAGIAIAPDGGRLYVATIDLPTVTVIALNNSG
jgi:YVTN family beta-propeller protein